MVSSRDPRPLEHHSYPKYTAAIKHSTWLEESHFLLEGSLQCRKDVIVEGRQCRKRISSLYRSKIQNRKQLAFHMGRKVRSRRKKIDALEQSVPAKLNVAQRHAIHPQTLNLQRKHTTVNILTYNRISFTLQQNEKKKLKKRTLK